MVSGTLLVSSLIGLALTLRRMLQAAEKEQRGSPRYVARSRHVVEAGRGVWDAREKRFLSDEELKAISMIPFKMNDSISDDSASKERAPLAGVLIQSVRARNEKAPLRQSFR